MKKVGYIGLGTMGFPMVKHLIENGFEVYILDKRGQHKKAKEIGAIALESPKAIAAEVDIIMTCLPMPQHILDVYEGDDGIIAGLHDGVIVVDHSTVDRETNHRVAKQIAEKGGSLIDAPVSGGPMGANAGTLVIMCGGEQTAFDQAESVMQAYGDYIVLVGETGSGSVVKLLNNMMIGIHQAALGECYLLAQKSGVDPSVAYDLIKRSSGFSKSMDWSVDAVLNREFEARFAINLLDKDIGLALQLAKEVDMPMEAIELGAKRVAAAKEKYGHEDVSSIIKPLEEKIGMTLNKQS